MMQLNLMKNNNITPPNFQIIINNGLITIKLKIENIIIIYIDNLL